MHLQQNIKTFNKKLTSLITNRNTLNQTTLNSHSNYTSTKIKQGYVFYLKSTQVSGK